jgi:hypothetical protein
MASYGEDHHDGGYDDEEQLPEPIYLSRKVLDSEEYYAVRSQLQHVDQEEEFESEDEAEETFDLTAPPLES